ncbi:MAG: cation diffusion facilitator family transporter [Ilumatobacter sp.]|uniref:cation diffusion facilitator family transporter n=1 Tax=Ilumatobacter sp. TaxID=1967498 RepID=UPI003C785B20
MSGNHAGHEHGHGGDGARLGVAAGANSIFAVVQILVGLAIGSVVVLADAAHQAVDALGLITAFVAIRIARRPASHDWSYGFGKADALGGFVSALLLVASVGWIVAESVRRLIEPESVEGGGVIVIGLIAIAVNGAGVLLVGHGHGDEAISLRAARLHLLTDLAGSVVVVLAGVLLVTTDASWIDPAASLLVSVAVLWSTWHLIRSAVGVLLDRSPAGMSAPDLSNVLSSHVDVDVAHHVHVRSLGAGRHSASAHVVVHGETTVHRSQEIVDELSILVQDRFGVEHITIQIECEHHCAEGEEEHDGHAHSAGGAH